MTMRRRFNPNAVANSDGTHTRVSHDRAAGTTGRTTRTPYALCSGKKYAVTPMQAAMLAQYQRVCFL